MTSTKTRSRKQALSDGDKIALATVAGNLDRVIDGVTKIGVAYIGFKAANHWTGALTNLVALRLAEGGNLAGGVAGVAVLAYSGLTQVVTPSDTSYLTTEQQTNPFVATNPFGGVK